MSHDVPNLGNIGNYDTHTIFQRPDFLKDILHVITPIFNSARYRSRWKLYEDFKMMVEASGAILYTVEIAFGDREFSITKPDNPRHIQLRTTSELWLKERAINLAIQRLPHNWKKVAWVDADISFVRSDWADETLHQLEHYDVVQMWSEAEDLSPEYESVRKHHSFVYSWLNNEPESPQGYYYLHKKKNIVTWHPGWAWAARRSAINNLGGLIDWGILGANDNHQAYALIGKAKNSIHPDIKGSYVDDIITWENRALRYIKKNVGYVPGKILHFHHGPKVSRKYWDRWKILVHNNFDPKIDLKNDWQGLFQLVTEDSRQQALRDQLRAYFKQRNEDSLEV
jgi:hypothetical protein